VRYGVLADIHANLHALRAVLSALRSEGVDAYLCPGDLVGYGPFPNECVELVAELEPVCVAGNHDLIALGRLPDARCVAVARASLRWTREVLADDARAYLAGLPPRAGAPGGIALAHGSLGDPQEYTLRREQAEAQLDRLAGEDPDVRALLLGHTHLAQGWGRNAGPLAIQDGRALTLAPEERFVLNPGGVGQSRERGVHARFLLLDLERGEATFRVVSYDVDAARAALRDRGLSERGIHLPPSRLRLVRRPLGRLRRRLRRGAARWRAT
jgi:predicted phosphodiesterase